MRTAVFLLAMVALGCNRSAPAPVSGPPAAAGWEIRYNAALALAQRGSDKLSDPVVQDLFKEMLDAGQQARNFRTTLSNGQEVPDPVGARTAVIGAIHALADYHRKRPDGDLTPFRPALDKLAGSDNPALAREARTFIESAWPKK